MTPQSSALRDRSAADLVAILVDDTAKLITLEVDLEHPDSAVRPAERAAPTNSAD
jgi:hypothetical protein